MGDFGPDKGFFVLFKKNQIKKLKFSFSSSEMLKMGTNLQIGVILLGVFSFVWSSFHKIKDGRHIASIFNSSCKHDTENFRCVKYLKNYDGDTITFDIKEIHPLLGNRINVRVSGVDTPEIKTKNKCEKKKAKQAKRIVASVLGKAKKIDLENVKRGKYFRIVADVNFDGQSLKKYLLKQKLAYQYKDGKKINWCE